MYAAVILKHADRAEDSSQSFDFTDDVSFIINERINRRFDT